MALKEKIERLTYSFCEDGVGEESVMTPSVLCCQKTTEVIYSQSPNGATVCSLKLWQYVEGCRKSKYHITGNTYVWGHCIRLWLHWVTALLFYTGAVLPLEGQAVDVFFNALPLFQFLLCVFLSFLFYSLLRMYLNMHNLSYSSFTWTTSYCYAHQYRFLIL
jgi:hypothetical protein